MCATIISLCLIAPAQAQVGKVMYAVGETYVVNGETRQDLNTGDVVSAGTALQTGVGRMQVKFVDGSYVALQPQTTFGIDTFQFNSAAPDEGTSLFNLVKGGIRAITGAIGRTRKSAYRVTTKVATIGIRGTTYKAKLCDGDCSEPNGLYASAGEGTIVLFNDSGEIELSYGENGFVASPDSAPAESTTEVAVADVPAPPKVVDEITESATKQEFTGGEAVFQETAFDSPNTVLPISAGSLALSGSTLFRGKLESGTELVSGTASEITDIAELNGIFNTEGAMVGVGFKTTDGEAGALTVASVTDFADDGILYLGRWTNTTASAISDGGFSETVNLDENDSVHYIAGVDDALVPLTGTASYEFGGLATPSTSVDGFVGNGIIAGSLGVDFGTQAITGGFTVDHRVLYNVTLPAFPFPAFSPGSSSFDTFGDITAPGCSFSPGSFCGASIEGFFAGSGAQPSRIGISYRIRDESRGDVVGAGGFNLE